MQRLTGTKLSMESILKPKSVETACVSKEIEYGRLYANIDYLAPGAKSCKFHSHTKQDEFFYILKGSCILRVGEKTLRLNAGDYFCKPAGQELAHQFINDSSQIVEILDVGAKDIDDVIKYPDEGITYYKKQEKVFKNNNEISNWSSDPN